MGNICNKQKQKCPMHATESITHICMHQRCIQPLCSKCLDHHYRQHKQIGSPPEVEEISTIKEKLVKSMNFQASIYAQTQKLHSSIRKIYPAEYIKELTREYFLRKRVYINSQTGLTIDKLIENMEQSQQVLNNPLIKQKYMAFLRQNTRANMGVLSQEYSHLY